MPCYDKKLEAARRGAASAVTAMPPVGLSRPRATAPVSSAQPHDDDAATAEQGGGGVPVGVQAAAAGDRAAVEVDLVLATAEILSLAEQLRFDLRAPPTSDTAAAAVDDVLLSRTGHVGLTGSVHREGVPVGHEEEEEDEEFDPGKLRIFARECAGSGGYCESVFRYACKELFGVEVGDVRLKPTRFKEIRECSLHVDGEEKLRFQTVYGFRGVQLLVQRLKRLSSDRVHLQPPHPSSTTRGGTHQSRLRGDSSSSSSSVRLPDFVEIMACPGGCLNGGGQFPPPDHYGGGGGAWASTDPSTETAAAAAEEPPQDAAATEVVVCNSGGGQ
eukprot:GHVU01121369.1.p1 GENE.GHVU01121369.1~~GHVU01121369.1.p1  ORF type:complete len:330 (+),score=81.10 GHVU01121369.1:2020-3009(+)